MLPIDLDIFKGLMENRRYGELAEGLGISENTVKYRIKRMLGIARLPKREDLIRLLVRYIS
jgi:DNA-binding CsgD family transcriptional regulator